MLIIASLHTYEQGSRKKQANRGRSARERATGGKLFSCNGIFTVDDKAMTKLYTLKPANSKTICHPPRLNRRARRKRAIALKSRNNVQATDWFGRAGPTKQRKSYHHFTMPPKTVMLTPSPTFGNQRNRRSWISRLKQLQSLPQGATTKNEKKENHRADTMSVSTRTRSKTEKRRIATGPVSARTRSRSKNGISNDNIGKQQKEEKIKKDKQITKSKDNEKQQVEIIIEVDEPQCQEGRELTVEEWELHFRNERIAAEREQKPINDGGKHGNTSCGTNYWTAGSPAFWTAQTNLNERENCEQQNGTLVSYELDTSTISSSTKNDSLEEKGYSSKGITQIEKSLFEVYIDRNDTLKITGGNPGEYLDGTLDSDWIDAEFNIADAADDYAYAEYIAWSAQEYFHTQIAREREDRFTQEVLNKLKRRGIVIKLEKEAVEGETKGKSHRCKDHGAARPG